MPLGNLHFAISRRVPMDSTLQDLKNAALLLPAYERAELAHFLLQTLEPEEDGWDEMWRQELARRLEEIRSGQVTGIPAEMVLARLRNTTHEVR
jgi:putative addiction module component (TIGR02574 family)